MPKYSLWFREEEIHLENKYRSPHVPAGELKVGDELEFYLNDERPRLQVTVTINSIETYK